MPDIVFPDLSNFQSNVDWALLRSACGVVAEQINWGLQITIPGGRIQTIRDNRFYIVIWYMGLRSDQDIVQQVLVFKSQVGVLLPGETVAIDWEATKGVGTPTVAQRDTAIGAVAFAFGRAPSSVGCYAPNNLLTANPTHQGWVWTASYQTVEPHVAHALWQYTNGTYISYPASLYSPVDWPGVGKIDTSVFHGSLYEMAVALGVTNQPPSPNPTPIPTPPNLQEISVVPHEITLPAALDSNGNGYYSASSLGIADINKIVSIAWIVGTPSTAGYQKIPAGWAINANQQFVVEGGMPGGQYGVIFWLSA